MYLVIMFSFVLLSEDIGVKEQWNVDIIIWKDKKFNEFADVKRYKNQTSITCSFSNPSSQPQVDEKEKFYDRQSTYSETKW